MDYSIAIANAIEAHMKSQDYKYTFDPERGVFKATFGVSDTGLIGSVELLIVVEDDAFTVSALSPVHAPKNKRTDVAEFLIRENWTLRSGAFEMDFSDGEIRYKVQTNCSGQIPTDPIISSAVRIPVAMFAKYGDALVEVITGAKTAEQAFNDAESKGRSESSALEDLGDILGGMSLEELEKLAEVLGIDDDDDE